MRLVTITLTVLLILIQYPLWYGGWLRVQTLEQRLASQQQRNAALKQHNEQFVAEVKNLQHGFTAIEERARDELGMVKNGEIFVQFVSPNTPLPKAATTYSLAREQGKVFTVPVQIVPDPPLRTTKPLKAQRAR